jgi:hypothetical protein
VASKCPLQPAAVQALFQAYQEELELREVFDIVIFSALDIVFACDDEDSKRRENPRLQVSPSFKSLKAQRLVN